MSESRYGPKLKRAGLSAVVALIAIWFGQFFGELLIAVPLIRVANITLDAGTALAIASFAVLIFKDVLSTVQKLGHYIWSGESLSVSEAFVLLAASTVATAIFSLVVRATPPECPKSWSDCASRELDPRCHWGCVVGHGIPHVEQKIIAAVEEGRKRTILADIASTPLLFTNAQTQRAGTDNGEPPLDEDSEGIRLQPDHPNQLRNIAELFKTACPQPERATLYVIGSSSEARFKNVPEEISDALNTRAAELRGQNVERLLRKTLDDAGLPDGVKIKVISSDKYIEIKRPSIKGVHYDSLPDPQYQARSVTVRVADPEACFSAPNPYDETVPTGVKEGTSS